MEYVLIVSSLLFFFFGAVRAISSLGRNHYHYYVSSRFKSKIGWIFPGKMFYAVGLVAIGWALAATFWWFYGLDWAIVAIGCGATIFVIQRPLRAMWNEVWHALTI